MTALSSQPLNINGLPQNGARMVLRRAPTTVFLLQDIVIPSIRVGQANFQTELDNIPLPGESLTRGTLDVQFKVDEDLKNYMELYNWAVGLTYPNSYSQFAALRAQGITGSGVLSDISVIIEDSASNPNITFTFQDAWITSISDLTFTTRNSGIVPMDVSASFVFRHFTLVSTKGGTVSGS